MSDPCEPGTDYSDCSFHGEYVEICIPDWIDEEDEVLREEDLEHWRREEHSTLQTFIVRCNHDVAEQIAYGHIDNVPINMSVILDPSTPRNKGAQPVDEGQKITLRNEAQVMHVEFGMEGDMRDINHDVENVYLLVITDDFSLTTVLHACESNDADTVVRVLLEHWLSHYPDPELMHTDGGSHFDNEVVKKLTKV